jgi:uncharacterized SAM-dependent methyltransferase
MQTTRSPRADLTVAFEEGETIWKENSRKYSLEEVVGKADAAGFCLDAQWVDREWPFAESLLVVR